MVCLVLRGMSSQLIEASLLVRLLYWIPLRIAPPRAMSFERTQPRPWSPTPYRCLMARSETHEEEPSWVELTHRALAENGIEIVGHVPDGGLRHLIRRLENDDTFTTIRLSTEEEGIAMAAGAWLGGSKAAVLMQSSGVGNCTNMLSLLKTCSIPAVLVVTMRGQQGESNPWQVPMSEAAAPTLELMGVSTHSAGSADNVAAYVADACARAFPNSGHHGVATAVLIEQRVIGVKSFAGDGQ